MVDRVERHRAAADERLLRAAVHASDPGRLAGEELGGEVPERGHELRLDQLELAEEVALAGLDLVGLRIAVPGRPALEHVRDVHVPPGQADALEQPVEELACRADERVALLVLVEAGRLADEHELGVRVADAVDDLRPALREAAARAAGGLGGVRLEGGPAAQRVRLSSHSPAAATAAATGRRGYGLLGGAADEPRTRRAAAQPCEAPQSGQAGSAAFIPTSSSKCDSHFMHTNS